MGALGPMINFFDTYKWVKWARVFILGTPFQPSLMLVDRHCLYSPTLDKAGLACVGQTR
jgi:hypothetical protein